MDDMIFHLYVTDGISVRIRKEQAELSSVSMAYMTLPASVADDIAVKARRTHIDFSRISTGW
jgi:hypothetical protein